MPLPMTDDDAAMARCKASFPDIWRELCLLKHCKARPVSIQEPVSSNSSHHSNELWISKCSWMWSSRFSMVCPARYLSRGSAFGHNRREGSRCYRSSRPRYCDMRTSKNRPSSRFLIVVNKVMFLASLHPACRSIQEPQIFPSPTSARSRSRQPSNRSIPTHKVTNATNHSPSITIPIKEKSKQSCPPQ
jgi:hypothetical protein